MSKEQYIKVLERQLEKLNREIDLKVISGQNYTTEARAHAELRKKMRQHKQTTFLNQVISAFTLQY
ncbi:MAG: hypothetical protein ACR2IQ_00925 [Minisyncoccia bacterium]